MNILEDAIYNIGDTIIIDNEMMLGVKKFLISYYLTDNNKNLVTATSDDANVKIEALPYAGSKNLNNEDDGYDLITSDSSIKMTGKNKYNLFCEAYVNKIKITNSDCSPATKIVVSVTAEY